MNSETTFNILLLYEDRIQVFMSKLRSCTNKAEGWASNTSTMTGLPHLCLYSYLKALPHCFMLYYPRTREAITTHAREKRFLAAACEPHIR